MVPLFPTWSFNSVESHTEWFFFLTKGCIVMHPARGCLYTSLVLLHPVQQVLYRCAAFMSIKPPPILRTPEASLVQHTQSLLCALLIQIPYDAAQQWHHCTCQTHTTPGSHPNCWTLP
eukprot:scaffold2120_cov16-Tisochrysis_lutea.AAC.1